MQGRYGTEVLGVGILPRACWQIFEDAGDAPIKVSCYFIEIYNDEFRDLLLPPKTPPAKVEVPRVYRRRIGA